MASTYTPIATTTLGSAAATVTFSSISGSYTDLVLIASTQVSASSSVYYRYNNDSGNYYSDSYLAGDGSSAWSSRYGGQTYANTWAGSDAQSPAWTTRIFNINNYSNTSTYKTTLIRTSTSTVGVAATVGLWQKSSAINRIDITANSSTFAAGSTFTLYGIKAA